MAVRVSALRAGRPLPPGRFLILLLEAEPTRTLSYGAVGRIRSIEKSNHLIGNRIRDLPACSIVPQPTTLLRAPRYIRILYLFKTESRNFHAGGREYFYGPKFGSIKMINIGRRDFKYIT
jgi:hypothetical protein